MKITLESERESINLIISALMNINTARAKGLATAFMVARDFNPMGAITIREHQCAFEVAIDGAEKEPASQLDTDRVIGNILAVMEDTIRDCTPDPARSLTDSDVAELLYRINEFHYDPRALAQAVHPIISKLSSNPRSQALDELAVIAGRMCGNDSQATRDAARNEFHHHES